MTDSDDDGYGAAAREGLREIAESFSEEIGRLPSLPELLEILTWGLRGSPNEILSDVNPANVVALHARFAKGRTKTNSADSAPSAVDELNDAAFSAASDTVASVARAVGAAEGNAPTLERLLEVIAASLRDASNSLTSDDASALAILKPELLRRGKVTLRPGDIVAIPAPDGAFFTAVVLDRNAFGTAYGLFEGAGPIRRVSAESHPSTLPFPVYTGDESLANGSWRIVGHDDELRKLFPAEPEIYHRAQVISGGPKIGKFGSAESASGRMRDLTKEEADALGLLTGEYRQVYTPELFERYLQKHAGGHRRGQV